MEKPISLETKYQNLAGEYSKLRANATVLKKAVLDEQARSREIKENLKEHEQSLRKANQEMESLTFRNQQLTKRISVLQEELNAKNNTKRVRGKSLENNPAAPANVTLLDEELQKKIIDNAQLVSAMADKDLELLNLKDRITEIEHKIQEVEKLKSEMENKHKTEIKDLKIKHSRQLKECEAKFSSESTAADSCKQNGDMHSDKGSVVSSEESHYTSKQLMQLEQEKERWKTEYELLLALQMKDVCIGDEKLTVDKEDKIKEFFYQRLNDILADKQEVQSFADSLATECHALQIRLELSLEEKTELEKKLQSSIDALGRLQEELNTTTHNYEQQLSTMSEHVADLNDKYTEQCELIQQLQYQLGVKGKKK